jgi:type I restriction enzyme M protein
MADIRGSGLARKRARGCNSKARRPMKKRKPKAAETPESGPSSPAVPLDKAGPPTITEILRGTAYALTIFPPKEVAALAPFLKNGKPYLKCIATDKDRPAKPEEIVRQLYLRKLMHVYGYPRDRIAVEKSVYFGSTVHEKAADIVVYEQDAPGVPYIIVELKKPTRNDGVEQLKSYCNAEGSPIGVWTNGGQTAVLHRLPPNTFRALEDIPKASQTLSQMLDEQWTIEDLAAKNKLVHEKGSLKGVILDMENLVLAGAGVDGFEEVFKLIFSKLYDEWSAARGGKQKRYLEFRVGSATAKQFADRVDALFARAKGQWPGVFGDAERINLEPAHLLVCGSFLETIKLFHSDLQIIDEAFEYLSVKAAKGEKGQYFTPRYVIDMCVKMLNPTIDEYVVDTAAGSCGFTVHSIFHVWKDEMSAAGPKSWQTDYARTHVYGIDFDQRSIKIAKALNLIAGDGRTNVYRANTLDPRNWSEEARVGMKERLRKFADSNEDKWNQENYRYFDFDVLLTNPPFAGEIQDSTIIRQFEIAKTAKPDWPDRVGRDLLFIQRNLEFLRPGGRAAIVLPQGRFNNSGDEALRRWIADKARILAVVGLHVNTFKPHTGTKTSVMLLQTWNENKRSPTYNPKRLDYPVFLATSDRPGKDNSGDYIRRIGPDNTPVSLRGHMVVEHDLDEIAEAFIEWGLKEGLPFAGRSE